MFLQFSLIVSKSNVSNTSIESTHTSFHSIQWSLNIQCILCFSVCSKTPYHHSLVVDLGSNHRLTRFHHFITTLVGLASIFQSSVWSCKEWKKGIYEKWRSQTERIEFDSMFRIEMYYTWSFYRLITIEFTLSSE